jgi:hypothetical protein
VVNDDEYAELFKKLPEGSSSGASWQDVATELGSLGRTLGDLVRGAWESADAQTLLGQFRLAVQGAVEDLNAAAGSTDETRQARDQLSHVAETIREAAARAGDDVRPQLLELLRRANSELRRASDLDKG